MIGCRVFTFVLVANVFLTVPGCSGPASTTAPPASAKYKNHRITAENYGKLEVGMKEADVTSLFGEPVETLFSAPEVPLKLDGNPVDRIIRWKDESEGPVKEIVVWVKDGQIVEKGQSGVVAKSEK